MLMCHHSGKPGYPTAAKAWQLIHYLSSPAALHKHKHRLPATAHAYHCHHCHGWHITSQPRADQTTDWRQRLQRTLQREVHA